MQWELAAAGKRECVGIQRQFNRIAENYSVTSKLSVIDGEFGLETETAI
ncbi:hypothetical protein CLOSTMETH_00838 [[Clostridium] methylpentosum DSM 5476]|uniref:Uncharacterized protein n=1 Tax=[Clostridium] methylpentosum DSM 5476 TaxID=537013 RepID=C0EAI3_9FIRM|nr:hypothetical protein CLOSTMETH_00838 [[Clostridium] methylpentosum DSM 5476]